MIERYPADQDLILIGGGHAHVGVIRQLAMNPIAGLRVTLINSQSETPYSGMLPGYLADQYTFDDCHIDLVALCRWAGVRLIRARVTGVDLSRRSIDLIDAASGLARPPLEYDWLSMNAGATPDLGVPGADRYCIAVKPIGHFVNQWQGILARASQDYRLAVVGGGVGAVEVAIAARRRTQAQVDLITGEQGVLPDAAPRARHLVEQALDSAGIGITQGPLPGSSPIACIWAISR